MAPSPVIHPADRLSRLPPQLQAQILSLLPAQEAVRTCILARAWRDVWKLTRRLLLTAGATPEDDRVFVDRLLGHRLDEGASLDECEIRFRIAGGCGDNDTRGAVSRWIHASLQCQLQALRVLSGFAGHFLMMDRHRPLVSRHLTRLELDGISFECCAHLNLDGCPALERLEISFCSLLGLRKIMSPSLKRLVITECDSRDDKLRFRISAPHLVSLWLEVGKFRAPRLESMPELVEAHVMIDKYLDDSCSSNCHDPMGCHHVMRSDGDVGSVKKEDYPEGCLLLGGLARAKDLYIIRRDLRSCPTFSNLKTLLLNGYWCELADCRPLACILEHAPVLEKLTVLFSEKVELKYDTVFEGSPDATAKSTMTTQCLKTVKVKCHTAHDGVVNVLKFLSTLNIWFSI